MKVPPLKPNVDFDYKWVLWNPLYVNFSLRWLSADLNTRCLRFNVEVVIELVNRTVLTYSIAMHFSQYFSLVLRDLNEYLLTCGISEFSDVFTI